MKISLDIAWHLSYCLDKPVALAAATVAHETVIFQIMLSLLRAFASTL